MICNPPQPVAASEEYVSPMLLDDRQGTPLGLQSHHFVQYFGFLVLEMVAGDYCLLSVAVYFCFEKSFVAEKC